MQGLAAKLDAYVASTEALHSGSTSMETLQAACCEVLAALQARLFSHQAPELSVECKPPRSMVIRATWRKRGSYFR